MPISVATPRSLRGLQAPLRAIVRRALAAEGRRAGEIAIVLTDDAALRDLNRRWRGIDRATDVLSFEYDAPPEEPRLAVMLGRGRAVTARRPPLSGDLVISLDRMAEQAKRYRVSPGRELARLVIHGALHLAGHDHHRASERQLMRGRENAALRRGAPEVRRLEAAFHRALPADRRTPRSESRKRTTGSRIS
jgi:probable rRNA maturation factor